MSRLVALLILSALGWAQASALGCAEMVVRAGSLASGQFAVAHSHDSGDSGESRHYHGPADSSDSQHSDSSHEEHANDCRGEMTCTAPALMVASSPPRTDAARPAGLPPLVALYQPAPPSLADTPPPRQTA